MKVARWLLISLPVMVFLGLPFGGFHAAWPQEKKEKTVKVKVFNR